MATPRTILAALAVSIPVALLGAGCSSLISDFVDPGLSHPPHAIAPRASSSPVPSTIETAGRMLDQKVASASAVQPHLHFPARIGLARIENGALSLIPEEEAGLWRKASGELAPALSAFTPVVHLVTASIPGAPSATGNQTPNTLEAIRISAGRQQLDAVLVYELASGVDIRDTEKSILNWTIIGAWARTEKAHARVTATAILLGVRNGYIYGTALGSAEDTRSTAVFGSEDQLYRQQRQITRDAIAALTPEVICLFHRVASSSSPHGGSTDGGTSGDPIHNDAASRPSEERGATDFWSLR